MLEAAFWGLVSGGALVAGAVLALAVAPRPRTVGLVMAFGAGVLLSAVAYELVEEAFRTAEGLDVVALGLAAGALTFFLGDALLERRGGWPESGLSAPSPALTPESSAASGSALDLGITTRLAREEAGPVLSLGVDAHERVHAAVALDAFGREAGRRRVAHSAAGRRELLAWAAEVGGSDTPR